MDSALDTTRFAALLKGLGRSFGLPDLQPDEDGCCILMFDEIVVTLQLDATGKHVTIHTQIGTLPPDASAGRLESLLAANLFWTHTAGATLALLPGNRAVVLARRCVLEALEQPQFEHDLAGFLDAAERWREELQKPEAVPANPDVPAMPFGMLA